MRPSGDLRAPVWIRKQLGAHQQERDFLAGYLAAAQSARVDEPGTWQSVRYGAAISSGVCVTGRAAIAAVRRCRATRASSG